MLFKPKPAKTIPLTKKFGSFAFYFSIPVLLCLDAVICAALISLYLRVGFDRLAWPVFAHGFLLFSFIFSRTKMLRLRTLLHELKHAVVVLLTGNKFKSISVGRGEGFVNYEAYKSTLHFEPFVILAPYFWPLLSLPTLIACAALQFFLPDEHRLLLIYILGSAVGTDIATSLHEISPWQSDLKRIFGGFVATRPFIYLANSFWLGVCMLWVMAGNDGVLHAVYLCIRAAAEFMS